MLLLCLGTYFKKLYMSFEISQHLILNLKRSS